VALAKPQAWFNAIDHLKAFFSPLSARMLTPTLFVFIGAFSIADHLSPWRLIIRRFSRAYLPDEPDRVGFR
jgi:hypothetical protein